jgi:hypothetical protein
MQIRVFFFCARLQRIRSIFYWPKLNQRILPSTRSQKNENFIKHIPAKCFVYVDILAQAFIFPQPEWLMHFEITTSSRFSSALLSNENQRGFQTIGRRSDSRRHWILILRPFLCTMYSRITLSVLTICFVPDIFHKKGFLWRFENLVH